MGASVVARHLGAQTSSLIGGLAGGILTTAIYSYGAYGLGYMSLAEANRMMVAGSFGTGAAIGAQAGTLFLVSNFATASTGASISALSGGAATNATMAWLGGGSVATGGGGMAAGSVVLVSGVGVVIIAGTAAVMWYYHIKDAAFEKAWIARLLDDTQSAIVASHY